MSSSNTPSIHLASSSPSPSSTTRKRNPLSVLATDDSTPPPPLPTLHATHQHPLGVSTLFSKHHTPANIALHAFLLGLSSGMGMTWGLVAPSKGWGMKGLGFFVSALSSFHMLEYLTTAMYRRDVAMSLYFAAFLLDHSREYHFAMAFGVVEYLVELYYFPTWKSFGWFNYICLILLIGAQCLRSLAMITAGHNFTHIIARQKDRAHVLVKTGVYKYFRHPAYTAFFYFALLLQVGILFNPLAAIGYVGALYRFFADRIKYEEELLVEFFGKEYEEYRKTAGTWIPGIP
ncbi:hypothetical protein HDV05_004311 [Chytridiales sp. JEL 0842]|nr:hypothetical protein HDV05_004311 [Chytridiales sp. JEL 0842]